MVTQSFPLVTVTSMLAPSPDWFVGVSGLSLLDGTNNWKNREEVELFVYDAGTDSGTNYNSGNSNTSPKENIRRIEESPFLVSGTVKSVGTFVFELKSRMTVDVNSSSVTVVEGSQSTFKVKLGSAPSSTLEVTVSEFSNSNLTRTPATLEFTPTDYSTWQTVTITAARDDNTVDESETLTLTANGGGYTNVTQTLTVNVTEDNEVGMEVAPPRLSINEGGSSPYTVRLKSQPTETVTVTIGGATASVAVNPSRLTFSTTDWSDAQTVTVTGTEDDDAIDESITLTHSTSGGNYGSAPTEQVRVTVNDDESAELIATISSLRIIEGESAMYSVRLNTLPSATVSVFITSNSPDVTVNPNTLTFTTTNWNHPLEVAVRAGHDDDASEDRIIINHLASGGNFGSVSFNVDVTVTDDDDPGLVLPTSITLLEGTSEIYTVKLLTEPQGTVTVEVTGGSGTVLVDTDSNTQGSQSTLTFSSSNWNSVQTITVNALEDDDESNDEITLTNTASGGDYASVEASITVSVVDNDEPGLMIIPTSLNVSEGASAAYTIQLTTQPTGDVTVTVSGASGDVTIDTNTNTSGDQSTLIFSTSSWNSTQTVTVTVGEDDDASNDIVTLTNTASGANYDSVESVDIEITVTDDEIAGASIVGPSTLSVDEGSSETFGISLAVQPSNDVDVTISAFSSSSLERVPSSLTFSPTNYDDAQIVTITASDDEDSDDESESILLTASGGGYDQAVSLGVTINVLDNDDPVIISESIVEVDEGSSANFNVSLGTIPTADVEVSISEFTISTLDRTPSTLTFTSQNYNQPQTVTVSADQDFNTVNETEMLTLTGSGGDYSGTSATVSITVTDDDLGKPTVNLSVNSNAVNEGESVTITATLSEALTGSSVTVPIVVSNDSAESTDYEPVTSIEITANQLTGTAELVTNEDDDFDDEVLDISFGNLPDLILPGTSTSVTVTIQDNDIEMVSVVFSQNIIGSKVDLYVSDSLVIDNFSFQSASMQEIEIGTMKMDVVAPDATDNTNPLYTEEIDLESDQEYHIVLQGQDSDHISTLEITAPQDDTSISEDSVHVHIAHSAPDLGQISIEILDPEANNDVIEVLSENLMYGEATSKVLLAQRQYNLAVNGGSNKHDSVIEVYSVDWSQSSQQKSILILSGSGRSADEGLNLVGVWQNGGVYFPDKVTSVEDAPVDDIEFAVEHYPNPFLDQTHLWLNLPEVAKVEIQIIDLLGRITYQDVALNAEVGRRYMHEINTSSWPSGVYFYRVVISTEKDRTISTGKMMRVK